MTTFSQLPDHARHALIRFESRAASEHRIEQLAEALVEDHGLADREWDCGDERIDVLTTLECEARAAHGLDDMQLSYLADLLDEWTAKAT